MEVYTFLIRTRGRVTNEDQRNIREGRAEVHRNFKKWLGDKGVES